VGTPGAIALLKTIEYFESFFKNGVVSIPELYTLIKSGLRESIVMNTTLYINLSSDPVSESPKPVRPYDLYKSFSHDFESYTKAR